MSALSNSTYTGQHQQDKATEKDGDHLGKWTAGLKYSCKKIATAHKTQLDRDKGAAHFVPLETANYKSSPACSYHA